MIRRPMQRPFFRRLIDSPLPLPPERYRVVVLPLLLLFATSFAVFVTVDAVFHESIMLGPGFVDEGLLPVTLAKQTLLEIATRGPSQRLFVLGFIPLLILLMLQNAWVIIHGYTSYEQTMGKPYRLSELVLMFGLSVISVVLLLLFFLGLGVLSWIFHGDFAAGFLCLQSLTRYVAGVVAKIPTVFPLPYPLPLVFGMLAVDFVAYVLHRLCHERRLPWLLLHRPHHMTEHLLLPTTQAVYTAVPLNLLWALPVQLLPGVLSKLFGPQTLICEALLVRLFMHGAGIYSHSETHYLWMRQNRLYKAISSFFGVGSYHYLHHSSAEEHRLCNLGNSFFMFWDRVFGTYFTPPETPPKTGLTGNPPLYPNPLRLALSGMLQIGYELRHNLSLRHSFQILFGKTDYTPPKSYDFSLALGKYSDQQQMQTQ